MSEDPHYRLTEALRKQQEALDKILRTEVEHYQALEEEIKGVTNGNAYLYRAIMLRIRLVRSFGQADGINQFLPPPDAEDSKRFLEASQFLPRVSRTIKQTIAEMDAITEEASELRKRLLTEYPLAEAGD